jgi:hypothetical protein
MALSKYFPLYNSLEYQHFDIYNHAVEIIRRIAQECIAGIRKITVA